MLLAGGGEAVSSPALVRVDPATGAARAAGPLDEPLSDLGAATVAATRLPRRRLDRLALRDRSPPAAAAARDRRPAADRPALCGRRGARRTIYVAGGLAPNGPSRAVYAVDVASGSVRRAATLPAPVSHAALAALGGRLLLVGGDDSAGSTTSTILAIDPASGRVRRAGTLPQPLSDAAAVTVGDHVVVLGGGATNASAAVYSLR